MKIELKRKLGEVIILIKTLTGGMSIRLMLIVRLLRLRENSKSTFCLNSILTKMDFYSNWLGR